ncbi:hypothetical protein GCM10007857_29660 [Bradyrhizobium iriomotense]|uniref:Uncharacterized protein n=1 Tax=Bradyrhizobium iriomotense TaxID=441950 RepID=A0ABQ6AW63_9BRAD|nr:hypothetical protein GCM10007857_29660 [Bradyrhizobium iriomotense]
MWAVLPRALQLIDHAVSVPAFARTTLERHTRSHDTDLTQSVEALQPVDHPGVDQQAVEAARLGTVLAAIEDALAA